MLDAKARNLKEQLLKHETILIAQIYLRVFSITEPVSKYLQTSGLDLLKSQQLVSAALVQLRSIQRDMANIKLEAGKFISWAENEFESRGEDVQLENNLPGKRIRRVKTMSGELSRDDPIENAYSKFTVDVHKIILDRVIESMDSRFEKNKELYLDLNILSPSNFKELKENPIPPNALSKLSETLFHFDNSVTKGNLQSELINFANSWDKLKNSAIDEYTIQNVNETTSSDEDDD